MNREDNRDGENNNDSTNCGVEGVTSDEAVLKTRQQLRRNLVASLLLARGVPMLLAGDEAANSQAGNNNAYCQDNEIGWIKWAGLGRDGEDLTPLIARLTELRRAFPQLRSGRWLDGRHDDGSYDILWLTSSATQMTPADWNASDGHFLSYILGTEENGEIPLFIVLNSATGNIGFTLPPMRKFDGWIARLNTASSATGESFHGIGAILQAPPRSVLVFSGASLS